MAQEWCNKMQFLFNLYNEYNTDASPLEFTNALLGTYDGKENAEFTLICESDATNADTLKRCKWIRSLKPRLSAR